MQEIARRPRPVQGRRVGPAVLGFGFENRADPVGYAELAATWGPYVQTVIEIFGPDRCMMESDYPVERVSCGFVPLWNALKYIVHSATPAEKAALFHGTAARAYRIPLLNGDESGGRWTGKRHHRRSCLVRTLSVR